MVAAGLITLANSVVKTAGLGETFDARDRAHIQHLQDFAKKAQAACVESWHSASPVQKVASRSHVYKTFSTASALEKLANVAEKTAALPAAAHNAIYRHAMDNDALSRDIFSRHVGASVPGIALTTTGAGTVGGLLAHNLSHNPYVSVPVGIATGLAGGAVSTLAAGDAARQAVLDSYLTRMAMAGAQRAQKSAANMPPHLVDPLFQHAMAHDPDSRAAYLAHHNETLPLAATGTLLGGAAVGVPLYYAKTKPLTYLGGAALGIAAGGYIASTLAERAAKQHVIDNLIARAQQRQIAAPPAKALNA